MMAFSDCFSCFPFSREEDLERTPRGVPLPRKRMPGYEKEYKTPKYILAEGESEYASLCFLRCRVWVTNAVFRGKVEAALKEMPFSMEIVKTPKKGDFVRGK